VQRLRDRLEAADAARREQRRRIALGVAFVAACLAGLAWLPRRGGGPTERQDGPSIAQPIASGLRVVSAATCDVAGESALRITLADPEGAEHCLLAARAPDGAGTNAAEIYLDDVTVRLWGASGVVLCLASPPGGARRVGDVPAPLPSVRRSTSLVHLSTLLPPDKESSMTKSSLITSPTSMLRAAVLVLAASSGVAAPQTQHPPESARQPPRLHAVRFHADWCNLCRKMGNAFDDLAERMEGEPISFIELDMTSARTRAQSDYLAAALGLEKVWQDHGRAAGFILLVDARTKSVVGRLTHDQGLDDMARRTAAILAGVR
jgi:thiol-disulfide isomerase/thioredoxin